MQWLIMPPSRFKCCSGQLFFSGALYLVFRSFATCLGALSSFNCRVLNMKSLKCRVASCYRRGASEPLRRWFAASRDSADFGDGGKRMGTAEE